MYQVVCPYCAARVIDLGRQFYKCTICKTFFESNRSEKTAEHNPHQGISQECAAVSVHIPSASADAQRGIVYSFIVRNPDCCIREISDKTNIQRSSICARLAELYKRLMIYKSGKKRYKNKEVETLRCM